MDGTGRGAAGCATSEAEMPTLAHAFEPLEDWVPVGKVLPPAQFKLKQPILVAPSNTPGVVHPVPAIVLLPVLAQINKSHATSPAIAFNDPPVNAVPAPANTEADDVSDQTGVARDE